MNTEGIEAGDVCNREGCEGIIAQHESDYGCSCHINPPCSYCTDSREYCPICGWEGREEQILSQQEQSEKWKPSEAAQQAFNRLADEEDRIRKNFYKKYYSNEPVTEYQYTYETHTHFSMKKLGLYPPEMTRQQVEGKVKGTFGGRFTKFDNGRFEYIAYTD